MQVDFRFLSFAPFPENSPYQAMSSSPFSGRLLLPLTLLLTFPPAASFAAVLQWDYDGNFVLPPEDPNFGKILDGSGSWDLAATNWTTDGGATNVAWTNPVLAEDPPNDAVSVSYTHLTLPTILRV